MGADRLLIHLYYYTTSSLVIALVAMASLLLDLNAFPWRKLSWPQNTNPMCLVQQKQLLSCFALNSHRIQRDTINSLGEQKQKSLHQLLSQQGLDNNKNKFEIIMQESPKNKKRNAYVTNICLFVQCVPSLFINY